MTTPTEELASEIDAFLKKTGMPQSAFGWATLGDPNLVRHLRTGRELKYRTMLRIQRFMDSYSCETA